MKLVIESGATKTSWGLLRPDGSSSVISAPGINFAVSDDSSVSHAVKSALEELGVECMEPDEVFCYGAGMLSDRLSDFFPSSHVECASDLLAAARALCGHSAGIAAILGTGSNSCFYDGLQIVSNVHPSGFILGDEGSGACLGKLFIADFLKGLCPPEISDEFASTFDVSYPTVVRNVYRSSAPSAYLGSFAPWILEHASGSEYVQSLVERNFDDFCTRCLKQYDTLSYPVSVVGGFAFAARQILSGVMQRNGIRIARICPDIFDLLIEYHR